MKLERLRELLARAAGKRIAVAGDLMLDEFVWGKVGRISPEAPVPVVEVTGESFYPGGAANVARNLREFTEGVSVIGTVGTDPSGRQLLDLLRAGKIGTGLVLEDPAFRTIVKTRIIARQQQVVRVDREEVRTPSERQVVQVTGGLREILPTLDAFIFEDYGKGFLSAQLVREISADLRRAGKIATADPNPLHQVDWGQVTAVKPNRSEALLAAGFPITDPVDPPLEDKPLLTAGMRLLSNWDAQMLLITLGEQGMMLLERNQTPHHIPTKARQVFDVSGAGDTAIALFTLALACDATPAEAAEIANYASAVVVAKLGTATVTPAELIASFEDDGA
ncbi:MAG TPA: PfkB family carbohydrate kinase [Chthoniobacterales bacterium]|jgi:D-beta-D-heptose 7-phosphate kinase/D-beta-D-heptose 1-phosphate adenosyltransferase|nr:PfkB family carbohydrate kinase [Chthoniobacterales bacterium]